MSRFPVVAGDINTWGNVLNDFLGQAHNANGSINNIALDTSLGGSTASNVIVHGALCDGVTDDSAALNAALTTPGAYVVPSGKTMFLANTVTLRQDSYLILMPGSIVKASSALNSSVLFNTSTAGTPTLRSGVIGAFGKGVIDPGSCTGLIIFDLHSIQGCRFEGLDILAAGDQTGTILKLRCDTATNGGYDTSKNCLHNYFGKISSASNGTFLDMAGAGATTQVAKLNTFEHINAINLSSRFITLGSYVNNNLFIGTIRGSLNQNNGIGLNTTDANTTFNVFQALEIDTAAGKTGRIGIQLGSGSNRTIVNNYYNDPAAEGGQIVDNGASSYNINGDWAGTGQISSGLASTIRGYGNISSVQALVYSTTIASDLSLVAPQGVLTLSVTNGTGFTLSNPTNVSKGQQVTYDITNSSGGAMGTVTWSGNFHLAGSFSNPANGKHRTITFYSPDGTNLYEISRAAADI
jgi:hypothetical protein